MRTLTTIRDPALQRMVKKPHRTVPRGIRSGTHQERYLASFSGCERSTLHGPFHSRYAPRAILFGPVSAGACVLWLIRINVIILRLIRMKRQICHGKNVRSNFVPGVGVVAYSVGLKDGRGLPVGVVAMRYSGISDHPGRR